MLVPVAVADLDEAARPPQQLPGQQTLFPEILRCLVVDAVELLGSLRFLRPIHQLRHRRLHAEGKFVRLDDAFDARVDLVVLQSSVVQLLQIVKLSPL